MNLEPTPQNVPEPAKPASAPPAEPAKSFVAPQSAFPATAMTKPVAPPPVHSSQQPVGVVNTYTPRGVEYMLMFISLWIAATSLGSLLHGIVHSYEPKSADLLQSATDSVLPLASVSLGVGLIVFAFMFLRLKKAELTDASIRLDSSRRRAVYLTVLITFLIGIEKIITYLYGAVNGGGGDGFTSLLFGSLIGSGTAPDPGRIYTWDLLHLAITLLIAGGIFAYYWRDMHKDDAR